MGGLPVAETVRGNLGPGVAVVGGDPDLDGTLMGELNDRVTPVVVEPFES